MAPLPFHNKHLMATLPILIFYFGVLQASICRDDWRLRNYHQCIITDNDTIIIQYKINKTTSTIQQQNHTSQFYLHIQETSNRKANRTIKCRPQPSTDKDQHTVYVDCEDFKHTPKFFGNELWLYYHLTLMESFFNNSVRKRQNRTVEKDYDYQPTWYSSHCCTNYYKFLGLQAETDYSAITLRWQKRWFYTKSMTVRYWDADRTLNISRQVKVVCQTDYCETSITKLVLCKDYHACVAFQLEPSSERCLQVKTRCDETKREKSQQETEDKDKGQFKVEMAISLSAMAIVIIGGLLIVLAVKTKRKTTRNPRIPGDENEQIIPRGLETDSEEVLSLDQIDPSFVTYEYPRAMSIKSDEIENIISNDRNVLLEY
ncbi:uncharacterized protein [Clytia hemisphaerica]|uniref:Cnidarian restricted protein n=1 Tax=Clytia hemisphaerica TaxID=252671 RepID=A0A7M5VC11_9CNID